MDAHRPGRDALVLKLFEQLQGELREIKAKVDQMDSAQIAVDKRLIGLAATPIEIDKLRFTPRVVVVIAATCISIAGGMYASTAGLRSSVDGIQQTLESQKQVEELKQKLAAAQAESLSKAVDAIDKRQQLQQIQIQELKEMVLKLGGK